MMHSMRSVSAFTGGVVSFHIFYFLGSNVVTFGAVDKTTSETSRVFYHCGRKPNRKPKGGKKRKTPSNYMTSNSSTTASRRLYR